MNEQLAMAKWYIKIGWSLIPIIPDTKKPAVKWAEYQERKPTIEEVTEWIKKGWYLAAVTGDISSILIVDDDRIKHNLTEWGFQSHIISKTQNNGKHFYFKYDRELHSHSNAILRIDLKAWHSYCLVPPFGNREWINKPSKENLSKLIPLSDEIVRLINSDTKLQNGERKPIILTDFVSIKDGARNDSIHKIACSLFSKTNEEEAIQILVGLNQTYTPPLPQSEFNYQVLRAKEFIKQNNKKSIRNEKEPANPLSLALIGQRRNEDRALEVKAPKTGYPELDELVKGFLPKHFWTLTGETNAGKTAFACNLAENVRRQDKKVLYVALEPEYKVVDYLASCRLNKSFEELTEEDIIYDDGLISIFTLAEVPTYKDLITSLKANSTKYDLIIIDHIGYFCRSGEEKSYLTEQGQTIRELVGLSKEIQTCIVAIAHPRKPSSSQKSRILNLTDISGSFAFAQDSTEVLVIYRPPINTEDPLCVELTSNGVLLVQKTKAGKNGAVKITFKENQAKIETHGSTEKIPQAETTNSGNQKSIITQMKEVEAKIKSIHVEMGSLKKAETNIEYQEAIKKYMALKQAAQKAGYLSAQKNKVIN